MATETLRQKQSRFAQMAARLIQQAQAMGYEVTLGEAMRSPQEAVRLAGAGRGIARSLHCDRLAIDLNLFKDGQFLAATEDHRPLGEWWESIGGAWGGRFRDGNHYSLAHEGRK
jgi:hypothetical protein